MFAFRILLLVALVAAVQAFVSSPKAAAGKAAVGVHSKGTCACPACTGSKSALFAQNGPDLNELLAQNEDWAASVEAADPNYFPELATGQAPRYLWIGCSDSRVPAELITKSDPGHLFVHRNIANQACTTDTSFLSVLEYAVDYLGVEDIIVCGHYECGGVKAASGADELGDLENWLIHIRNILGVNKASLDLITDANEKHRKAVDFNVEAQCLKLWANPVIQNHAKKNGKAPRIHGLSFDIKSGKLVKVPYDMSKLSFYSGNIDKVQVKPSIIAAEVAATEGAVASVPSITADAPKPGSKRAAIAKFLRLA